MSATYAALDTARRMTEAATRFLETLDAEREALASFPFDSDVRQDWHYVPRSRVGLPRGRMDGTQLESAHALMASGLSAVGARKAEQIIRHESILGRIEGDSAQFLRDPGLYFFNIFGRPGADDSWGWRVEGHHLSLNYTFDGGELQSPTPSFFGANPAEVPDGPEKGLRILETEEELGRDLFMSLNEEHRARAVVYADAPRDMITRADREVALGDPVGLPASAMTADQRDKLMTLVRVYLDKNSEELRAMALRKIERSLGRSYEHLREAQASMKLEHHAGEFVWSPMGGWGFTENNQQGGKVEVYVAKGDDVRKFKAHGWLVNMSQLSATPGVPADLAAGVDSFLQDLEHLSRESCDVTIS